MLKFTQIYCVDELIRQVTIECAERGLLLLRYIIAVEFEFYTTSYWNDWFTEFVMKYE